MRHANAQHRTASNPSKRHAVQAGELVVVGQQGRQPDAACHRGEGCQSVVGNIAVTVLGYKLLFD